MFTHRNRGKAQRLVAAYVGTAHRLPQLCSARAGCAHLEDHARSEETRSVTLGA